MSTLRELVSDIRSQHKMLSSDALITDRFIASKIREATLLLVKRETNLRRLWSTDTIFTTISCLEMQEVSISECCDYSDPCTVSRTKFKLPKLAEGNYNYLVQGVWSINAMGGNGQEFKYININRYTRLLKLPVVKKEYYYWIVGDYLYTNNPLLQAIRISAFFEEDISNDILFSECCGKKSDIQELCKNPLDKDYNLPGYLEQQVKQLVSDGLMNTYFRLKTDLSSDGVDGQAPNTKPTN